MAIVFGVSSHCAIERDVALFVSFLIIPPHIVSVLVVQIYYLLVSRGFLYLDLMGLNPCPGVSLVQTLIQSPHTFHVLEAYKNQQRTLK